jgi:hypothetical protein
MHRSGTSCLAGCLQAAGLHLGGVNTQAPYNAKGNREFIEVMRLNDRVLAANGGSWRDPPDLVEWTDDLRRDCEALVATLAGSTPWGFKDPRTILTLGGWLDVVGDADLVASVRHPTAVAHSLHRRDPSLTVDEGLRLWRIYNERLLEWAARGRVWLISYDAAADAYGRKVTGLAETLGLREPVAAAWFFDGMLRHDFPLGGTDLPADVTVLYGRLQELCA